MSVSKPCAKRAPSKLRQPRTGWLVTSLRAGDRASRAVRFGQESGERIAEVERVRSTWRALVDGEPLQDGGEEMIFASMEEAIEESELHIAALGLDEAPPTPEEGGLW